MKKEYKFDALRVIYCLSELRNSMEYMDTISRLIINEVNFIQTEEDKCNDTKETFKIE